ncbi:MAG TPA: 4-alpha-glucanotransferase [Anaerovoracaceae bacterium]|nr:4-alpha-glucanotransferase [Anaerovoracaceae bacterium]
MINKRSSGILMHITSLPGKYGIGDFGEEAYRFVDFLVKSKQKNWQILPLGVTGYGDSPYQCFSAFAGNPYFIDLNEFLERGFLKEQDLHDSFFGSNPYKIDYSSLYKNKMLILKKAYKNGYEDVKEELHNFYREKEDWLRNFALFMSIKHHYNNESWIKWDEEYKEFDSEKVKAFEAEHQSDIFFWVFTQYYFLKQWKELKKYANDNGVNIIGDLPIYVSEDSADLWANSKLFKLNEDMKPITVAGVPPDAFSSTGQLWGNPIYNWKNMENNQYNWWVKRIKFSFELYDRLRIDHFRGFESYWEVEYGAENAINGKWVKGPGMKLFNRIKEELGDLDIIAEDLGFLTEEVYQLIKNSGFPGMKVLQFAFDPREESDYLPHNYNQNSVVYTGTHDNETTVGWFDSIAKEDFLYAVRYLKLNYDEGLHWGFVRGAWSSVSNLAVAPMQDFLGLNNSARMNKPSTNKGNWTWRVDKRKLTDELALKIANLTQLYKR